jgi:hypothetical protein
MEQPSRQQKLFDRYAGELAELLGANAGADVVVGDDPG